MEKRILYLLIFLICCTAGWLFYQNTYTRFIPTIFNTQRNKGFKERKVDSTFYQKLPKVLIYHNIDFQVKDHIVYIKRKVADDQDLVWNFTTKALDQEWIKTH